MWGERLSAYQATRQNCKLFSTESWVWKCDPRIQMKTSERKCVFLVFFYRKVTIILLLPHEKFFCKKLNWFQARIVIGECTEKNGRQKLITRRRWFQLAVNQTKLIKPNRAYQIKPTRLNLPNQTYQTKPTKPNLPNQTCQTKPTKPNLPNQIKLSLPSILNQTYQTKITGQSSQRLGP